MLDANWRISKKSVVPIDARVRYRGISLFELTLGQRQRQERRAARADSVEMEWVSPFPSTDAGISATAPPGRLGESLEVIGVQAPGLIGRRQEVTSIPPRIAADGFASCFERVFEIDLRHAPPRRCQPLSHRYGWV